MARVKPDRLTPEQMKALDLWFAGMQHKDIAKTLGVTENTITNWVNSDLWQAAVKERTAPAKKRAQSILLEAATDAANTLALKAKSTDVQAAIAVLKAVQVYVERQERVNPDMVNQMLNGFLSHIDKLIDEYVDADKADRFREGLNTYLDSQGWAAE